MIGERAHGSAEVRRRIAALRHEMDRRGAALFVCCSPANQTYLCGFRALLYSRAILLVVGPDATTLVVPALEETHARRAALVDDVRAYHEQPQQGTASSAVDWLDDLLGAVERSAAIAIEFDACPAGLARRLAEHGCRLIELDAMLTTMRAVKDATELAAVREAARITRVGVDASLQACRPGTTEIEVDGAGTRAVLAEVARLPRPVTVEELVMTPSGRERSILPHAFSTTRRLEPGDALIHTRQVGLDGYRAELERSVFVGRPSREQRRAQDAMRSAQAAAIAAVRAGVRCADVDRAARSVFDDAGLSRYAVHRTGHGIGLAPHEPPFLRYDNPERLVDGMTITVEPGIYVPGHGGFRHSDTFLVTSNGAEPLT
jgi:Xaa-Pro dipeptidase